MAQDFTRDALSDTFAPQSHGLNVLDFAHQPQRAGGLAHDGDLSGESTWNERPIPPTIAPPASNRLARASQEGLAHMDNESNVDTIYTGNDQKQKRLARKAELARASRRRKKQYVTQLEDKVVLLTARIAEIEKRQSANPEFVNTAISADRSSFRPGKRGALGSLASPKPTLAEIDTMRQSEVQELVARYSYNKVDTIRKVNFFIEQVEQCLCPGAPLKFTMWGLDQPESFYEPEGMWTSLLSGEFGLSSSQMDQMMKMRKTMQFDCATLQQSKQMLADLRKQICDHCEALHVLFERIRDTMSLRQAAKFYTWVHSNDWVIHMLNTMWVQATEQPSPLPPPTSTSPPSMPTQAFTTPAPHSSICPPSSSARPISTRPLNAHVVVGRAQQHSNHDGNIGDRLTDRDAQMEETT